MITEGSAEDMLNQILSYLNTLVDAVNRMFENIDITNLNEELANKINNSLTEHQDMSAYATSGKVRSEFRSCVDSLGTALGKFKEYVADTYVTPSVFDEMKAGFEGRFITATDAANYATQSDYSSAMREIDRLKDKVGTI
jgi:hypothetical protein